MTGLPPHPGSEGTHAMDALAAAMRLALDREMAREQDKDQAGRLKALRKRTRGRKRPWQAADHEKRDHRQARR
jgi:hypothetical protein